MTLSRPLARRLTAGAAILLIVAAAGCSGTRSDRRLQGQIIGGATGAAVGSLFGGGTGKVVATGAGAVIGAIAGGEIADKRR